MKSLIECPKIFEDHRGSLSVLHECDELSLKRSVSLPGTFRGMHRQTTPFQQSKIIRVIEGQIVDLQLEVGEENIISYKLLTPQNDWLLIDTEFAHGFYAVDKTVFEYICVGPYNEKYEKSYNIVEQFEKEFKLKVSLVSEKDGASQNIQVDKWIKL